METSNELFTRKDYMNNKCTHFEYYSQFASIFINWVENNYTKDYLTQRIKKDKHLNNLENGWMRRFDLVTESYKHDIAIFNDKINGQMTWSYSTGCCAIKAAMRQIVNS